MAQQLNEYLEMEAGRIRCRRCGHDICAADQNYKLWVLQERGETSDVPGAGNPRDYDMADDLELRRYYCPGCTVQLDVEVSQPDAEPLWDIQVDPR